MDLKGMVCFTIVSNICWIFSSYKLNFYTNCIWELKSFYIFFGKHTDGCTCIRDVSKKNTLHNLSRFYTKI